MNPRPTSRHQPCSRKEAKARLSQAKCYLGVAEYQLAHPGAAAATVATGNAVLAAIAAADAVCCAVSGSRPRGPDHKVAARALEEATGRPKLGALFRAVLDLKDSGHYGLADVSGSRAKSAVRKARDLVTAAGEFVG